MTPGARRALEEMAADEDCDLVQSGIECWCGTRRTTALVVRELIWMTAISVSYRDGLPSPTTYYTINTTGRALLRRPELEADIFNAMRTCEKFSIVNDRLISADDVFGERGHGQSDQEKA